VLKNKTCVKLVKFKKGQICKITKDSEWWGSKRSKVAIKNDHTKNDKNKKLKTQNGQKLKLKLFLKLNKKKLVGNIKTWQNKLSRC